jgi:hypothetical protein
MASAAAIKLIIRILFFRSGFSEIRELNVRPSGMLDQGFSDPAAQMQNAAQGAPLICVEGHELL